jgi:transcriptional regulator with XRE-family HTH domain
MKAKRKETSVPTGGPKHDNRIGEIRQARGLTRKALAALLDCHDSQVFKLERGDTPLTFDWMYRLCRALDCTQPELMPEWRDPALKQRVLLKAWAELSPEERVEVLEKLGIARQNTVELPGNLPNSGPKNPLVRVSYGPNGTYELEVFAPQKENSSQATPRETKQKDQ